MNDVKLKYSSRYSSFFLVFFIIDLILDLKQTAQKKKKGDYTENFVFRPEYESFHL